MRLTWSMMTMTSDDVDCGAVEIVADKENNSGRGSDSDYRGSFKNTGVTFFLHTVSIEY